MDHPSFINQVHVLVGRLSVHQDFFWFFSLLGWSFVLIAWWRHPRRGPAWPWLPWCAGVAIASAFIQFGMFNPTFDLFQERLIPGTVSDYRPAVVDPYWLGDILLAAALAVLAAGWGARALTRSGWAGWRWLPAVLAGGALLRHVADPVTGGTLLAALTWLAAAALWLKAPLPGWSRLGLALAALIPVVSTVGPLAAALHQMQRDGPPAPAGLAAAGFQMLLGGFLLARLLHEQTTQMPAASRLAYRRELRPFALAGAVLLAAGLIFGIQTGRDNRREIQQNRLRTTAAHAAVFDPALFTPLLSPKFRIETRSLAGEAIPARSAWLAHGEAEPARRRLAEVVRATPFLKVARLVVIHDGWLVAALSSDTAPGQIELLRRATPQDLAQWEKKEPYVEESPVPEIGYSYSCRAPVLGPDGRMLGWLDCVRSEYYLSIERRWRAAPFVMTDLGIVLLVLVFVQRRAAREREAALRAAAVADAGSRIKTAFLAKVSHELRTPLQSILGYSELLRSSVTGAAGPAQLEALRQQSELMIRLVNDLIDLSAAEVGAFQLAVRPVDPVALVQQTAESLRPRAAAKGLALDWHLTGPVPAWVSADGDRLRQVLANLAGNAIKFTDRGRVTLTLHAATETDGLIRLAFAVQDTGPGIAPADQGRLFAAFARLARTADKEGSGLGLALSGALCRAMGGSLTVQSDGVNGSTFTAVVRVPAAVAPVQNPAVAASVQTAPRVLVVDDNRLVRELFTLSLTEHGARCRVAASGAAALAAVAREKPDVIVLDLALPDGDGADFAPRLRLLAPGVRIIGASAHAGADERERALAAGMDRFLTKPVPLDELWRAVAGTRPEDTPAGAYSDPTPEVRERMLRDFIGELSAQQAGLAHAVAAGDWTQVRAGAHYLRNSALVVQATALYEAYTGLEAAAVAADPVAARRWWTACGAGFAALQAGQKSPPIPPPAG